MKIAQVAPLYESVPPQYYGGTERVVSYLTEALVQQGHEVTLFASGDSLTQARLVAACARSLRLADQCIDQLAHHDQAIAIARQVGMPLKVAAKVDRIDREYFQAVIRPLLDTTLVEYVGEIGDDKGAFLETRCLLATDLVDH